MMSLIVVVVKDTYCQLRSRSCAYLRKLLQTALPQHPFSAGATFAFKMRNPLVSNYHSKK